jgi:ribose-phosphate pyrophosphokinase
LAEKIASFYGNSLGKVTIERFKDGEFRPCFNETVRGAKVFIIGSTHPGPNNLMELLLMIDAAKRASAEHIVAVVPYFGWARQDRKDKSRVPIGAKMIANILQVTGANRLVTMDLHADQIQGFFEYPVDHLFASAIFIPYIKKLNLKDIIIASPDMGGSKRAHTYSSFLSADVAICYKQRDKANSISSMQLIGEVEGKDVILLDDMIDTGTTIAKAAHLMMDRGAKSVRAFCTHPILSGNAYETLENSKLEELVVTDTIPLKQKSEKINVLSCSELFARVMKKIDQKDSISTEFVV